MITEGLGHIYNPDDEGWLAMEFYFFFFSSFFAFFSPVSIFIARLVYAGFDLIFFSPHWAVRHPISRTNLVSQTSVWPWGTFWFWLYLFYIYFIFIFVLFVLFPFFSDPSSWGRPDPLAVPANGQHPGAVWSPAVQRIGKVSPECCMCSRGSRPHGIVIGIRAP